MVTMNISLPEELRAFADARVSAHLFASTSEYVRGLIRRDRESVMLRDAVLEGMRSGEGSEVDDAYFDRLRAVARRPS